MTINRKILNILINFFYLTGSVIIEKKNMIGVVVLVSIIVIALVVALSVFIYRHRRLQRSFLSFASTHYSTRSGSATFTNNDGLGMYFIKFYKSMAKPFQTSVVFPRHCLCIRYNLAFVAYSDIWVQVLL